MSQKISQNLIDLIKSEFDLFDNKVEFLNDLKQWMFDNLSMCKINPVDNVRWVKIDKVQSNDYNPNKVAKNEMRLLYTSISHDGFTQPIVTVYDKDIDKYIIVDGFHRYAVVKFNEDIYKLNNGLVPIVVLKKNINDRMASTIRHNRARGKHSIDGMGNVVFNMLRNGIKDKDICFELGLEADELLRLKHITGFSKLFNNVKYNKAWETPSQLRIRKDYGES